MTIRKGEEWGTRIPVPDDFLVAEDDADLAGHEPHENFALRRGDLHKALGEPRLPNRGSECTAVPIDGLLCRIRFRDGSIAERFAVSSVTIGSWWSGEFHVVSNSGFLHGLNIAPRSHPNDGVADLISFASSMSLRQRLIARRRAATGTHVPHPDVTVARITATGFTRSHRRQRLTLDGRAVSEWEQIDIQVIADHWTLLL
jgi:hypothetical protein